MIFHQNNNHKKIYKMLNFITILFIVSIFQIKCLEINLTNGITEFCYEKLEVGNTYSFYIQVKQFQNATFQIYNKMGVEYVEYISVSEYSNRNNNKPDKEQNLTVYFNCDQYDDSYAMSSYIVSLPNTSYIAFKVTPKRTMSFFYARVDVINGLFDLTSGEAKKISNVFPGDTYIFYIRGYEQQNINITLTTDYINDNPFNTIMIYQYQYRNETIHETTKSTLKPISKKKSGNQLISSYSYSTSSDNTYVFSQTNYLALKVDTTNISYFNVKIDNPIEYYDLENGVKNSFYNLKSNTTYFFYGKGEPYQIAKISCENNLSIKPFDNVIIYELRTKTYDYYNIKGNESISFTSENNQSSILSSYEIKHSLTKLAAFRIKPLHDIDYIEIKISIQGYHFRLSNGYAKNVTNIIPGEQYVFLISTNLYDIININLTTNYVETPFTKINIFESTNNDNQIYIYNSSLSMNTSRKGNQLVSYATHIAGDYYSYLFTLKLFPNNGIKYITAKIDIEKALFNIDNKPYIRTNYNLKSGNNYYAYMHIFRENYGKKINLILNMSYIDYMPFDYIYLCESKTACNYFDKKVHYKDMIIKVEEGNKIIASLSYQISNTSFSNLYLRFSPKYNIAYFSSYYENEENIKPDNGTKPNETKTDDEKDNDSRVFKAVILSITSTVIFIIIMTILICIFKKDNNPFKNYADNLADKPLYPVAEIPNYNQ